MQVLRWPWGRFERCYEALGFGAFLDEPFASSSPPLKKKLLFSFLSAPKAPSSVTGSELWDSSREGAAFGPSADPITSRRASAFHFPKIWDGKKGEMGQKEEAEGRSPSGCVCFFPAPRSAVRFGRNWSKVNFLVNSSLFVFGAG